MTKHLTPLQEIQESLLAASRKQNHKGFDPFDGLNSRLFNVLQLNRSELLRLAWLQLHKHLPVNIRSLVGQILRKPGSDLEFSLANRHLCMA